MSATLADGLPRNTENDRAAAMVRVANASATLVDNGISSLDGVMLVCQSSSCLLWRRWSELVDALLIFANEAVRRWEAVGATKAKTPAREQPAANELTIHSALNFMLIPALQE